MDTHKLNNVMRGGKLFFLVLVLVLVLIRVGGVLHSPLFHVKLHVLVLRAVFYFVLVEG